MTRRRAASRILRLLSLMMLVTALGACSRSTAPAEYQYLRVTINGYQTLGISPKEGVVRGVVVYFHDAGVDEFALTAAGPQQDITGSLVQSGFAVISAGIGKDGFGTPELVDAYLKLGAVASDHYRSDRLYLLSSGLGAIPAVGALAELPNLQRVRGLIAINPVLNLQDVPAQYMSAVAPQAAVSDGIANPMRMPVDALDGRRIAFFVDDKNETSMAQVRAFSDRFGAHAEIDVNRCAQSAGSDECYPGDVILKRFSKFEQTRS